jgi:hypothetical protein
MFFAVLQQDQPPLQRAEQAAVGVVEPGDVTAAAAEGVAVIAKLDETDALAAFDAEPTWKRSGSLREMPNGPKAVAIVSAQTPKRSGPVRLVVSSSSTAIVASCPRTEYWT